MSETIVQRKEFHDSLEVYYTSPLETYTGFRCRWSRELSAGKLAAKSRNARTSLGDKRRLRLHPKRPTEYPNTSVAV